MHPRITITTAAILRVLLDDRTRSRYGYEIMAETGIRSGSVYPTLSRLLRAGWLDRQREDTDPKAEGRPVRYWYRLTEDGATAAEQALTDIERQITPRAA